MDTATLNGIAYIVMAVIALGFVAWLINNALKPKRWVCPECRFETYSEEEALGHAEYHKTHHKMYEAE